MDELIAYYENIFAMYDSIIGLDGSAVENKKVKIVIFKSRYIRFGGAYYGANWTANSSDSTKMWLDKLSWGALHEIAHGYQAGFDNQGIFTGEVSNNLFGVQYQYSKYGKKQIKLVGCLISGKRNK